MAIVVTSEACDCADTSQRRSGRIEPLKRTQLIEYADVAQLAEQLICNQQVNGSSPFIGFRSEMTANAKSICKQKKAVRKLRFLTVICFANVAHIINELSLVQAQFEKEYGFAKAHFENYVFSVSFATQMLIKSCNNSRLSKLSSNYCIICLTLSFLVWADSRVAKGDRL